MAFGSLYRIKDVPLRRYASAHDGRPSDTIHERPISVVRVVVVVGVAVVVDVIRVICVALIG